MGSWCGGLGAGGVATWRKPGRLHPRAQPVGGDTERPLAFAERLGGRDLRRLDKAGHEFCQAGGGRVGVGRRRRIDAVELGQPGGEVRQDVRAPELLVPGCPARASSSARSSVTRSARRSRHAATVGRPGGRSQPRTPGPTPYGVHKHCGIVETDDPVHEIALIRSASIRARYVSSVTRPAMWSSSRARHATGKRAKPGGVSGLWAGLDSTGDG